MKTLTICFLLVAGLHASHRHHDHHHRHRHHKKESTRSTDEFQMEENDVDGIPEIQARGRFERSDSDNYHTLNYGFPTGQPPIERFDQAAILSKKFGETMFKGRWTKKDAKDAERVFNGQKRDFPSNIEAVVVVYQRTERGRRQVIKSLVRTPVMSVRRKRDDPIEPKGKFGQMYDNAKDAFGWVKKQLPYARFSKREMRGIQTFQKTGQSFTSDRSNQRVFQYRVEDKVGVEFERMAIVEKVYGSETFTGKWVSMDTIISPWQGEMEMDDNVEAVSVVFDNPATGVRLRTRTCKFDASRSRPIMRVEHNPPRGQPAKAQPKPSDDSSEQTYDDRPDEKKKKKKKRWGPLGWWDKRKAKKKAKKDANIRKIARDEVDRYNHPY